jgi:hypothetical protein
VPIVFGKPVDQKTNGTITSIKQDHQPCISLDLVETGLTAGRQGCFTFPK